MTVCARFDGDELVFLYIQLEWFTLLLIMTVFYRLTNNLISDYCILYNN